MAASRTGRWRRRTVLDDGGAFTVTAEPTPGYETLRVARDGAVAVVTLARPERRNALNPTMFAELSAALGSVIADEAVRTLVVHGDGGHFCSGADVREGLPSGERPLSGTRPRRARPVDPFTALHDCPIPTLAAVEGAAVGIGLSLALACDVVVAARAARLQLLQVRVGLVPDGGASWVLSRLVGPQRAAWLALSGAPVTGADAAAIGLVAEAVDDTTALATALQRAHEIAERPRPVLERVKRVTRVGATAGWHEAFAAERDALVEAYASPEYAAARQRLSGHPGSRR